MTPLRACAIAGAVALERGVPLAAELEECMTLLGGSTPAARAASRAAASGDIAGAFAKLTTGGHAAIATDAVVLHPPAALRVLRALAKLSTVGELLAGAIVPIVYVGGVILFETVVAALLRSKVLPVLAMAAGSPPLAVERLTGIVQALSLLSLTVLLVAGLLCTGASRARRWLVPSVARPLEAAVWLAACGAMVDCGAPADSVRQLFAKAGPAVTDLVPATGQGLQFGELSEFLSANAERNARRLISRLKVVLTVLAVLLALCITASVYLRLPQLAGAR